ncbi:MAG: TolC family outer membrane protein [Gemmatimonadetes bacterium]|nr:TolC family outer membrane protein [Gemmatimonadota bacterium]
MRWSRSLMLLCLLLSCSSARAEDLLDIYELARQHDPLIQAAQFANLATRESLRQAYSGLLPTLSAGAEYDLTRQEILDSDNPLFQEGTSDFGGYDLSLTLNQPLFRYAAIVSVRQAKDVVARSGLEYFVAEQELVLRVAELYLQALSAQDDLGFARAEQAALQLHYERAQGQQARGLIPVTDLYDAQARLAAAQEREFSAKDAQDDAFEALREVSGDRVANPAGIKEELPLGPPDPATVEQWIEAGLKQNLALQVQALTVGVASREVDRRQAGHLPTLDLVARGNRQRTGGDLFGKGRDTEILNVGVELRLPLYQGGLVNSQVKEATYLYQRARKEHERLVRSVERTTRSAYWGVISAIGRVEALQQSVAALELALDGRQKGFRSGLFPSLDVLDGVRDLFRSRRDYARARYDYILNSLRLKQMVGTLSEKDIVAVNQWLAE